METAPHNAEELIIYVLFKLRGEFFEVSYFVTWIRGHEIRDETCIFTRSEF